MLGLLRLGSISGCEGNLPLSRAAYRLKFDIRSTLVYSHKPHPSTQNLSVIKVIFWLPLLIIIFFFFNLVQNLSEEDSSRECWALQSIQQEDQRRLQGRCGTSGKDRETESSQYSHISLKLPFNGSVIPSSSLITLSTLLQKPSFLEMCLRLNISVTS